MLASLASQTRLPYGYISRALSYDTSDALCVGQEDVIFSVDEFGTLHAKCSLPNPPRIHIAKEGYLSFWEASSESHGCRKVLVRTQKNKICVYELQQHEFVSKLEWRSSADIHSMVISGDGKLAAVLCEDATIHVWNTQNGTTQNIIECLYAYHHTTQDMMMSHDGSVIAFCNAVYVCIWRITDGAWSKTKYMQISAPNARAAALSPDGTRLITINPESVNEPEGARLYDTATGLRIATFNTFAVDWIVRAGKGARLALGQRELCVRYANTLNRYKFTYMPSTLIRTILEAVTSSPKSPIERFLARDGDNFLMTRVLQYLGSDASLPEKKKKSKKKSKKNKAKKNRV